MNNLSLRRAFALFHSVLAVVICLQSILTLMQAQHHQPANPLGSHLAILAAAEGLAALLFLFPTTLKAGGVALLLIFSFAIILHGVQHELNLLVYATGVLFVIIHGSAFSKDLFQGMKR